MKPYIICHMLSSVDGRTDGDALAGVTNEDEYEATSAQFESNAWLCGRTTMQEILGNDEPFASASNIPAGSESVHVARLAESYAVCVDTHGKLRWTNGNLRGDHLICLLSEQAPSDYLGMLKENGVSYIVAGASSVNLIRAMDLLGERFGIRTLLIEGGGHINGAFLQAGLIDEVSLLIAPGIDGRHDVAATFDGMNPPNNVAVALRLKSVEQRANDTLWIRYDVL
ncbi:MAG: bifunctional deaminase-reductase domain protein [Chthoniobacteraceae bacterium]|nr:bifunctional deaminase-reductase domain protein [Chthoniobacteraceae bacterium]